MNILAVMFTSGLGALAMYLLDPEAGRRRRATARDKMAELQQKSKEVALFVNGDRRRWSPSKKLLIGSASVVLSLLMAPAGMWAAGKKWPKLSSKIPSFRAIPWKPMSRRFRIWF